MYRRGHKRALMLSGAIADSISILTMLDPSDCPPFAICDTILMRTGDGLFYSGFIIINPEGKVNVHWYAPGASSANNIGNEQTVFGQIEWNVSLY